VITAGIDVGNQGAIVCLDGDKVVLAEVMPLLNVGKGKRNKYLIDMRKLWETIMDMDPQMVVLEKAQSMPGQGVSSVFNYGVGFGALQMALIVSGFPHEIIHPRKWQKVVLDGLPGNDTKKRAILKCQRRLPSLDLTPGKKRKPHEGLADAACMALFAQTLVNPHETRLVTVEDE